MRLGNVSPDRNSIRKGDVGNAIVRGNPIVDRHRFANLAILDHPVPVARTGSHHGQLSRQFIEPGRTGIELFDLVARCFSV